tara:strand:- start:1158 stop:1421 length:264 start_codon:yes stop_codon:yes gene_type:complete
MAISPQSIRKGVQVKFNNVIVDKKTIIEQSESWTENQEILFRKFLKQGGKCKIQGIKIEVTPQHEVLTSKGEKPSGKIVAPGIDQRF